VPHRGQAPVDDPLKAFRRNPDGSWSCITPVTLKHPAGPIEVAPGTTFIEGRNFMGIDPAEWLGAMDHAHAEPPSRSSKERSQKEAPS